MAATRKWRRTYLAAPLYLAVLAAIYGAIMLMTIGSNGDPAAAGCGGKSMRPGDVCQIRTNGSTREESYGQRVASNRESDREQPVTGTLFLCGGLVVGVGCFVAMRPARGSV